MTRPQAIWRAFHAFLLAIVLAPIVVYRTVFSPLKRGPSCRFVPSCSEYASDALRERGIIVGGGLALWRVLRCQPLCRGGFDPVPRHERSCCEERS
jgi:putative membrane protein insertion efficiency factor